MMAYAAHMQEGFDQLKTWLFPCSGKIQPIEGQTFSVHRKATVKNWFFFAFPYIATSYYNLLGCQQQVVITCFFAWLELYLVSDSIGRHGESQIKIWEVQIHALLTCGCTNYHFSTISFSIAEYKNHAVYSGNFFVHFLGLVLRSNSVHVFNCEFQDLLSWTFPWPSSARLQHFLCQQWIQRPSFWSMSLVWYYKLQKSCTLLFLVYDISCLKHVFYCRLKDCTAWSVDCEMPHRYTSSRPLQATIQFSCMYWLICKLWACIGRFIKVLSKTIGWKYCTLDCMRWAILSRDEIPYDDRFCLGMNVNRKNLHVLRLRDGLYEKKKMWTRIWSVDCQMCEKLLWDNLWLSPHLLEKRDFLAVWK